MSPRHDSTHTKVKSATAKLGKMFSPAQEAEASSSFIIMGPTVCAEKNETDVYCIGKRSEELPPSRVIGRGGAGSRSRDIGKGVPDEIHSDDDGLTQTQAPQLQPALRYGGRGGAGSRPRVIKSSTSQYDLRSKNKAGFRSKWTDKPDHDIRVKPQFLLSATANQSSPCVYRFGRSVRSMPSFEQGNKDKVSPTSTICSDFNPSLPSTPSDPTFHPSIHAFTSDPDQPWIWNTSQTSLKSPRSSSSARRQPSAPAVVITQEADGCTSRDSSIHFARNPLTSPSQTSLSERDRPFGAYLLPKPMLSPPATRASREREKSWNGEWNDENLQNVIQGLRRLR